MRLSRRVIGYVSVVMCALSVVLIAISAVATLSAAQTADRENVVRDSERAQHAIQERADALGRNAIDWSAWDNSYQFAHDRNQAYIDDNLPLDTMDNLRLNLFAVYDPSGRPIYICGYDLVNEKRVDIQGADRLLVSNPALNLAGGGSQSNSGVVKLPDGKLLLVGAGPVLPTARNSKAAGTLVMGRLLDSEEASSIAGSMQLDLAVPAGVGGPGPPTEVGVRVSRGAIQVTSPLRDLSGVPVGAVEVRANRNAFNESLQSVVLLCLSMALTVLVTVLVIHRGLRRIVIDRVGKLDAFVERVRLRGHPEPVNDDTDDELGTLSVNVAEMVSALEFSHREVELRAAELDEALCDARSQMERREAAEDARRASEARYRLLIDNMNDAVFLLSADGVIEFASPSVEPLLGHEPTSLVGRKIQSVLGQDSGVVLARRIERGIAGTGIQIGVQALTRANQLLDAEFILAPFDGDSGEVQGILRDITDRKRHENELIHVASHDFLTGLCNRRHFEEELYRELAQSKRRGRNGAVLWLDLDNFKDINDTLGHRAGDEMLIEVASRLAFAVRAESLLARLGGDEFAVLLPGADRAEAIDAAARLIKEVNEIVLHFDGKLARASTSIGVVLYPEHGQEVEELLSRADVAMYGAKDMGRSRLKVFEASEEWRDQIEDRRVWIEMVELALVEDGLMAYAQPIVDTVDGRIVSYELLVRMRYGGEVFPPARFLPVAERMGLIVDIDLWMLRQAVNILATHPVTDFRLNVNVSARTLGDPRFLIELERLVADSAIEASRLTIEITETAIIVDVGGVQDTLRRVKRLGCRIALDDFGSGFTSFLHLRQLPVDDIKIDGAFVQTLCDNKNDQHLVLAMVEMARGLSMLTTAEFVESSETLDLLQSFGVDMAQGYQIAKPGPALEVIDGAGRSEAHPRARREV
jgi:diguanylate cyclase (GGDEF)-like protein/PAS domain S-box-containing protein